MDLTPTLDHLLAELFSGLSLRFANDCAVLAQL